MTVKQLCSCQGKDKHATARNFCRPPASARYLYCTLPHLNTNNNAKPKTKRALIQGTAVDGGWGGQITRKEYRGMVDRSGRNCDHFHCDPSVITKFLALCGTLMFITVIRTAWH